MNHYISDASEPGYVYIAHIPHDNVPKWDFENDLYKIGYTRFLKNRLHGLKQEWNQNVSYIMFVPVKNIFSAENILHEKYKNFRCNKSFSPWIGNLVEYFLFDDTTLNDVILSLWKLCNREFLIEPSNITRNTLTSLCKETSSLESDIGFYKEEIESLKEELDNWKSFSRKRTSHLNTMCINLKNMMGYCDYELQELATTYINEVFYSDDPYEGTKFKIWMDKKLKEKEETKIVKYMEKELEKIKHQNIIEATTN